MARKRLDSKTLSDYNIWDLSTIHILGRLRGRGDNHFRHDDFQSIEPDKDDTDINLYKKICSCNIEFLNTESYKVLSKINGFIVDDVRITREIYLENDFPWSNIYQ